MLIFYRIRDTPFLQLYCKRQIKKHKTESDLPLIMPKSVTANYCRPDSHDAPTYPAEGGLIECDSIQVLRSVAAWSAGVADNEQSIYKAYRDLITSAKQFLYIENQFFVSSAKNDERNDFI